MRDDRGDRWEVDGSAVDTQEPASPLPCGEEMSLVTGFLVISLEDTGPRKGSFKGSITQIPHHRVDAVGWVR